MTFTELAANNAALSAEVWRLNEALKTAQLTIDKMRVELAYLRRMKYGQSSERLEDPQPQLDLAGAPAEQAAVALTSQTESGGDGGLTPNVLSLDKARKLRLRPGLREIPKHLSRRTVVHTPQAKWDCLTCGAGLRAIGQDVSEVLDYEPGTFHAVRHVRPKLACARCRTITQAPAPAPEPSRADQ